MHSKLPINNINTSIPSISARGSRSHPPPISMPLCMGRDSCVALLIVFPDLSSHPKFLPASIPSTWIRIKSRLVHDILLDVGQSID
jgi:hypothetical protein